MHLLSRSLRPGALFPCLSAVLLAACADQLTAPAARPAPPLGVSAALGMPAFNGNIRIGVVPAASSITVGSNAPWTLTNKVTGAVLMTGTSGSATITLASTSSSETRWRVQVMCGSAGAVAASKAAAEALGHVTMTEVIPACTRLLIGSFPVSASFTVRNNYRLLLISQGLAAADAFYRQITIVTGIIQYKAQRGADVAMSANPVVLNAGTAQVLINASPYRGIAEVAMNSAGTLAGINQVPLEEYLYGVVPRELPPGPWPQPEAQKAQAVAARTYALRGLGKRASDGYDLLPTVSDQVYGGYAAEHPVSTAAVDATAGIVATFRDAGGTERLIEALFSSTTGGWTASNEEIFNSAPVSYLRSVPDAQRGEAFEHVPTLAVFRNHANPRSLRAEHHGSAEADWSSRHRWTFEWSAAEMSDVISAAFAASVGKTSVGTVREINVLERGPSGRVIEIQFVTDEGTFTTRKDAIRGILKFIDASNKPQNLYSTLFFIEPVVDNKTEEIGYRVFGGGWGHGIGLGQTGAAGMAQKGATFDEILKHYYQGIELTDYRTAN